MVLIFHGMLAFKVNGLDPHTIAAAISIMLATVCHYMIEDPCTNLGKKLAQRFIPNK